MYNTAYYIVYHIYGDTDICMILIRPETHKRHSIALPFGEKWTFYKTGFYYNALAYIGAQLCAYLWDLQQVMKLMISMSLNALKSCGWLHFIGLGIWLGWYTWLKRDKLLNIILMVKCKMAVFPVHCQLRYCCFTLSHWYNYWSLHHILSVNTKKW